MWKNIKNIYKSFFINSPKLHIYKFHADFLTTRSIITKLQAQILSDRE